MSRKNIIRPFKLASAQSLAANFTSNSSNIDYLDNIGIIIVCTGVTDNIGTFYVQARAKNENASSPWITLPLSNAATIIDPTLADANANFDIFIYNFPFSELRVGFSAAGTVPDGTCDIWIESKQVGG